MQKLVLVGVSVLAVITLVLGSQANMVGFSTIQAAQQTSYNERMNQRMLLYQVICDLANNRDIQKVILESNPVYSVFKPYVSSMITPVLTPARLNIMYGLSMVSYRFSTKDRDHNSDTWMTHAHVLEKMDAIIENNKTLSDELTKLSFQDCSCQQGPSPWYPVLCSILEILMAFEYTLSITVGYYHPLVWMILVVIFFVPGIIVWSLWMKYCYD